MGLHPPRHGPARAVPAPPSAQGVPDTGCRRGRPPRPPTSVLTHEGSDVGRGARPARPSGLTHRIRLPDVPYWGRAAEDVGPYHRFRPTDRSPPQPTDRSSLRPTDRSAVRPTEHRPVRCVIRPCSRRGFGDERDFASERSEVKSRGPSSLGTTRGVPGAGCPTRPHVGLDARGLRRWCWDGRDFTSERSEVKSRIAPPVCACVKKGDVPK